MAKRMLVQRRYLRIKVSLEMERLNACLLERQKIKLLRAQKRRAFFPKASAKVFTHQNGNYLLGSIGVFLAFDARFSSDASSREVMEKLIMMEKQLSICTLQWYMGRWTPPLPMWYHHIGLPHSIGQRKLAPLLQNEVVLFLLLLLFLVCAFENYLVCIILGCVKTFFFRVC